MWLFKKKAKKQSIQDLTMPELNSVFQTLFFKAILSIRDNYKPDEEKRQRKFPHFYSKNEFLFNKLLTLDIDNLLLIAKQPTDECQSFLLYLVKGGIFDVQFKKGEPIYKIIEKPTKEELLAFQNELGMLKRYIAKNIQLVRIDKILGIF